MSLRVSDLVVEIGERTLLRATSFDIQPGEKISLVGRNGAGKTTLLRTLGGERRPASGKITMPAHWAWLPQDTSARAGQSRILAYDYLLSASGLHELRDRMGAAQSEIAKAAEEGDDDAMNAAIEKFGSLESKFRHLGGYELESEGERIAAGVGLSEEVLLENLGALSGGQRRRLELARMLLRGGDLLILDEPTNHLDVEAKNFVMTFLKTTQASVILVSHDVELISESIDRVFYLENGSLDIYKGTYKQFQRLQREREDSRDREIHNAQKEVARLEKTKQIFAGANEVSSRKRKQFEARIEKVKREHLLHLPPVKKRNLKITFPEPIRTGDIVLQAKSLTKAFDDRTIFSQIEFIVERGESFIVIGVNGAGKTTLLRCIADKYKPDAGTVKLGANVNLGFYAQEHEDIPPGKTLLQLMGESAGAGATQTELRGLLGHFGLSGDVASQEAVTLSGGEKTKLSLARLVAGKANVLLLDEPTNNLDVGSREALAGALQNYRGTIVLVSHDLEFVTQLQPERAITMPSGRILPFDDEMLRLVPAT